MSPSSPTPQPTTPRTTPGSKRLATPRPAVSAPTARRRARRRQAVGRRLQRFETTLPGLRADALRGPAGTAGAIGFTGFVWSKLLSLSLLVAVLLTLFWINGDERWYVYPERVQVTGQHLLDGNDLSTAAGVTGWNIFWLQRNEVRDRILTNPWITAASVSFGLPAQVRVKVSEAAAIGVWDTNNGDFWISPTGAALPMTEAAPVDMARLVDPQMAAMRPGSRPGTAVDTNIVASALALMANVPGVTEVRYSPDVGLHFGLPGTTLYIHWGDGEHLQEKLRMLNLGRQLAATGEMKGQILDVRFPSVVTTR